MDELGQQGQGLIDVASKIQALESKLAQAEGEIVRLNGKTGFCVQCEDYAKKLTQAEKENKVLKMKCDGWDQEQPNLMKVRDERDALLRRLTKERDAFGKRETELMAKCDKFRRKNVR
jgi:hypothetical protein